MGTAVRIYLDACALNRLTDDPSQSRVRAEAEAVELFFKRLLAGEVRWVSSSILEHEILRNPDALRREDALGMLPYAAEVCLSNAEVAKRARFLNSLGYGEFDALHLAIAENAKVDLLLTTDDRFLRRAGRGLGEPAVRVANPLDYAQEVRP